MAFILIFTIEIVWVHNKEEYKEWNTFCSLIKAGKGEKTF